MKVSNKDFDHNKISKHLLKNLFIDFIRNRFFIRS